MQTAIEIGLAALIAALALFGEHWFPWGMIFSRRLPHLVAYVLGVLALILPLTGLYAWWGFHPPLFAWAHLVALWVVITAGGAAVMGAYGMDWILDRVRRSYEQDPWS